MADHDPRHRGHRRDRRVQALAAPVHASSAAVFVVELIGGEIYYLLRAATARTASPTSGAGSGYSFPAPPVAVRRVRRRSASPTRSSCRAAPNDREGSSPPSCSACSSRPSSTSRSTTRSTSSSASRSRRDPPERVPVLHAQRRVPGRLPARGRPRTSTSTGRRGDAIRQAVQDQLGLTVARHRAGRPGGIGRLDAAAAPRRRRARRRTSSGSSTR